MSLHLELLRHGETDGNGGFRGALDDALSATGWAQMRAALEGQGGWDLLVASPKRRCLAFAQELGKRHGLEVRVEPDLRELDFGQWEGRSAAELMETEADALDRFWSDPYTFTPPGGEPLAAFETRVLGALGRLAEDFADRRLLAVTHGGVIRLTLALARGLPPQQLLQIDAPYACRQTLLVSHRRGALHLEPAPCAPC